MHPTLASVGDSLAVCRSCNAGVQAEALGIKGPSAMDPRRAGRPTGNHGIDVRLGRRAKNPFLLDASCDETDIVMPGLKDRRLRDSFPGLDLAAFTSIAVAGNKGRRQVTPSRFSAFCGSHVTLRQERWLVAPWQARLPRTGLLRACLPRPPRREPRRVETH